ncbi:MAG: hypothetical protein VYA55_17615 [Pseudomonadota bacterium]|nr:hypothetical protein [Pseudomonadota bacterium]
MKILFIYIGLWFGLALIAIVNGAIREKVYAHVMPELSAHQLSTLIGITLFAIYTWIVSGYWNIPSALLAIGIGGIWLLMTLMFEFGFGHYVMGHPWEKLLQDYDIMRGRVWILVLIWTALAPYICYRARL